MMAQLRDMTSGLREKTTELMRGEAVLTKLDLCLLGAVLFLAGMCIGLLTAPLTHGVSVSLASHNGSNNGNGSGNANDHGSYREEA